METAVEEGQGGSGESGTLQRIGVAQEGLAEAEAEGHVVTWGMRDPGMWSWRVAATIEKASDGPDQDTARAFTAKGC